MGADNFQLMFSANSLNSFFFWPSDNFSSKLPYDLLSPQGHLQFNFFHFNQT